jgi:hydrogenase/urease accessory protein HupE
MEVVRTYLALGLEHILLGIDHLLFLLALLLLVSGWRRLVATITAFSVSHCATLTLAALGYVRVPGPPVEAAIALSIVFVAGEILQRRRGRSGLTLRWPWSVSFTFGLLHGLGFAGALHEVGLPQRDILLALAFFSVGVELGQLAFVAAVLVTLGAGRRALVALRARADLPMPAPAALESVCAYGIGGLAAFWLVGRTVSFLP